MEKCKTKVSTSRWAISVRSWDLIGDINAISCVSHILLCCVFISVQFKICMRNDQPNALFSSPVLNLLARIFSTRVR